MVTVAWKRTACLVYKLWWEFQGAGIVHHYPCLGVSLGDPAAFEVHLLLPVTPKMHWSTKLDLGEKKI